MRILPRSSFMRGAIYTGLILCAAFVMMFFITLKTAMHL